jgi:hypothetical protein
MTTIFFTICPVVGNLFNVRHRILNHLDLQAGDLEKGCCFSCLDLQAGDLEKGCCFSCSATDKKLALRRIFFTSLPPK